jgi:hypothetical protein
MAAEGLYWLAPHACRLKEKPRSRISNQMVLILKQKGSRDIK